eukprot:COSAG01_NODE_2002_length_8672_cov_53.309227_9_plen_82_part_00
MRVYGRAGTAAGSQQPASHPLQSSVTEIRMQSSTPVDRSQSCWPMRQVEVQYTMSTLQYVGYIRAFYAHLVVERHCEYYQF